MIVRGEGPQNARLMFVGEAPGKDEHFRGRPFIGKSGKVLTAYLRRLGVDRQSCYVTNLVKEWPGEGNPDPTPEAIAKWGPDLRREIEEVAPDHIICLGRLAGNYLTDLSQDMNTLNGMSFNYGEMPTRERRELHFISAAELCTTYSIVYHPAAGLHEPSLAAKCFWGLKTVLNGAKPWTGRTDGQYLDSPDKGIKRGVWIAIDTEGSTSDPWGLSWSTGHDTARIVQKGVRPLRIRFEGLLVLHNSLHDLPVLRAMGLTPGPFTDTMVLAYLLQTEPQGLKALAFRHLGKIRRSYEAVVYPHYKPHALGFLERVSKRKWKEPEERPVPDPATGKLRLYKPQGLDRRIRSLYNSLEKDPAFDILKWWRDLLPELRDPVEKKMGPMPTPSLTMVPLDEAIHYSGADAADTAGIYPILLKRVKEMGLEKVAAIDMAVLPVADAMQSTGIGLDLVKLAAVDSSLQIEQGRLETELKQIGGRAFNPGSPDQVAKLIFGPNGFTPDRMTKKRTRPTTDDKTLESLKGRASMEGVDPRIGEAVSLLLDYREVSKLISTYTSALPGCVAADGRVHPRIHPTRVVTGRWSMSEPNLQNIPVRGPLGKAIRECFIAQRGYQLVSVDLSQIELRMVAHESEDQAMCGVYQRGEDIHESTRAGLGIKDRIPAKTVNFGVLYGISAAALLEQLHKNGVWAYDPAACEAFIAAWFATYPGVRPYLESKYAEARRYGYVRDWCGRIRWVPNIYVDDNGLKAAAEREAGNFPIQAGATEVGKIGMAKVWEEFKRDRGVRFLLWIHDELILEVVSKRAKEVAERVRSIMSQAVTLRVPVEASMAIADNWGSLK